VKHHKKTRTIVEKHEIRVVRRSGSRTAVLCRECENEAGMVAPEDAAILASVSQRKIYQGMELGRVHFTETPDGRLLVCLASCLAEGV
jgi:hypothetical protein